MAEITITLPDGSAREVAADSTVLSLATSISRNLGKAAIAGVVNGQQVDLSVNLSQGDSV
jgi:threonyl-tRNA synthetase